MKNRIAITVLLLLLAFTGYSQTITTVGKGSRYIAEVNLDNDKYTVFYLNNKYKHIVDIKYINLGTLEDVKRIVSTRNEFIEVNGKLLQFKQKGNKITMYVSYRGVLSYTKTMSVKQFDKLFNL